MSSNNHGARPNIQPALHPKPVAISPLRQPLQRVIGQPMVPRLQPRGNVVQSAGQSSLMVGSVSQPLNVSQPRMTPQVFQAHQPRMAMYVQGQVQQANIPKIVTGVPVYQNTAQFQQGQIRIQQNGAVASGSILKPVVSGMPTFQTTNRANTQPQVTLAAQPVVSGMPTFQTTNRVHTQPQMTLAAQPVVSGMPTFQSTNRVHAQPQVTLAVQPRPGQLQGQFQTVPTNQVRPHLIPTGQALPAGQMPYRAGGQMLGYPGFQVRNMHPVSSTAVPSQGPPSLQILKPRPETFKVGHSSGAASTLSPQVLASVSQIPTPKIFTTIGNSAAAPISSNMSPQTGSTPVSPMVPLSPSMFQVAMPLGQSQRFTSAATLTQLPPTMLRFGAPTGSLLNSRVSAAQQGSVLYTTCPATVAPVLTIPSLNSFNQPKDLSMKPVAAAAAAAAAAETVSSNKPSTSAADNLSIEPFVSGADTHLINPSVVEISDGSHPIEEVPSPPENFQESVLNLRQNKAADREKKGSDASCEVTLPESTLTTSQNKDTVPEPMECEDNRSNEEYSEGLVTGDSDEEFIWEEYLQDIGAFAVPPTAFKHVEFSLQSGFVKGMKLEVPNRFDPSTYWVTSVIMTCGPLLRLRFDGYEEDSSADFWCDLATSEIHSIGWCAQNGRNLQPPEEIKYKFTDWREYLMTSLTGARTAPSFLLDKEIGSTPIDQLKPGMRLELQDGLKPLEVWLVQIVENVGGRLYLRLEGLESASKDFWMFYLNIKLHPIGWGKQEGLTYKPPKDIQEEHSPDKWEEILASAIKQSEDMMLPVDVFNDQIELTPHKFEVGMKLEALNPSQNLICPATVVKVINNKYFMIEIDDIRPKDLRTSTQICCHSEYLGIFPISFSQCKGVRLQNPPGWDQPDFLWGEYLSFCNAKAAPERLFHSGTDDHEFERGMKLEAVNPDNPNQICAATITKIVGPLLWIHLDNMRDVPSHIEDIDSHNLFPVGWCESNGYQLKLPRSAGLKKTRRRRSSENLNGEAYRSETYSHVKSGNEGGSWCPKIFFNHRCFSGPYLSKGRISELPKSVGPGPMGLVLKEVLTLLINVAYKSSRVLKELQQEGVSNPNMQSHMLKAKYKGKIYTGVVEVCRTEAQLEEFCRNICIKLECCPYIFSLLYVEDNCPENCQQLTKTKYNYSYGKKKKKPVGRPPGSHSNLDGGPKIPAKRGRKKKRHFHLIQKKSRSMFDYGRRNNDVFINGETKDEGFIDDDRSLDGDYYDDGLLTPSKKRKYVHHLPPPSDIQTRGAKLPKYSFERKTHKKILLSSSSPPAKAKERLQSQSTKERTVQSMLLPREESLHLDSNPLSWSINQVVAFIKQTDCCHLARIMKEQEIDGQALLLLNLSTIQEHLQLKLGPAVKLCHEIERLKVAFFENYA